MRGHTDEVRQALSWSSLWLLSEAALRRTAYHIDVVALETCLAAIRITPQRSEMVGLVRHDGRVLTQVAVADKITAAPRLLAGHDLIRTVVTVDASLIQRSLGQQIRRQDEHDLMAVKENLPSLLAAIETLFADPP